MDNKKVMIQLVHFFEKSIKKGFMRRIITYENTSVKVTQRQIGYLYKVECIDDEIVKLEFRINQMRYYPDGTLSGKRESQFFEEINLHQPDTLMVEVTECSANIYLTSVRLNSNELVEKRCIHKIELLIDRSY